MEAVKTEKLTKVFGTNKAVDSLDLSVEEGEIFGLVGPDGAGKTTTMRLLASVMNPTSGNAWVNGYHITKKSEAIKKEIGYMSQRFGLYTDLTVEENITFYADVYRISRKERKIKIPRLLEFSNLYPFRKRLAGNLSGGMKQKLGIICALIHTPKILFLDEPTNGVDPVSRRDFWTILYGILKENVTIFVSTAYLDEAERCNRIGLMHNGKLLSVGTPSEVKKIMKDQILELRCKNPRNVYNKLKCRFDLSCIYLFGDKIHIVTSDTTSTGRYLKDLMDELNLIDYSIRDIYPSLEDVFVSVISKP